MFVGRVKNKRPLWVHGCGAMVNGTIFELPEKKIILIFFNRETKIMFNSYPMKQVDIILKVLNFKKVFLALTG